MLTGGRSNDGQQLPAESQQMARSFAFGARRTRTTSTSTTQEEDAMRLRERPGSPHPSPLTCLLWSKSLLITNLLLACLPWQTRPAQVQRTHAYAEMQMQCSSLFFICFLFPLSIDQSMLAPYIGQETSASKAKQCFSSSLAVARCDHTFMIRKILR